MTKTEQYKDALKKMEEAKKNAKAVAKEAFVKMSSELFKKHPEMTQFSWSQYTPYFNDGDTCEFSANTDQNCLLINDVEEGYEICNDSVWDSVNRISVKKTQKHPLFEAQKSTAEFLAEIGKEQLKEMFGDHCQVTVKNDGTVEVSDYEHE